MSTGKNWPSWNETLASRPSAEFRVELGCCEELVSQEHGSQLAQVGDVARMLSRLPTWRSFSEVDHHQRLSNSGDSHPCQIQSKSKGVTQVVTPVDYNRFLRRVIATVRGEHELTLPTDRILSGTEQSRIYSK